MGSSSFSGSPIYHSILSVDDVVHVSVEMVGVQKQGSHLPRLVTWRLDSNTRLAILPKTDRLARRAPRCYERLSQMDNSNFLEVRGSAPTLRCTAIRHIRGHGEHAEDMTRDYDLCRKLSL